MKNYSPKKIWKQYKEFKYFKKKKQDLDKMDDFVFNLLKTHLEERQIHYKVRHPDDLIEWSTRFDDQRNGLIFYYKEGTEYVLDSYCYELKEGDEPIDYVRFSNVFNSLLFRGNLHYNSSSNVLRFKQTISMREIFWEPDLLNYYMLRHYSTASDISKCAHDMHQSGKDPFDVVADFMNSKEGEKAN